MLNLSEMAPLGREVRQDGWGELGTATPEAILRALDGVTRTAYPWSWSRSSVPCHCVHCALNELLPMEWGGHPLWVTEYHHDASRPCAWHFYKRTELIPAEVYERVGREKPEHGQGRY